MRKPLEARLRLVAASDAGITVIEVMVAMTIFAVIAAGLAAGVTATLVLTKNAQARSVASSLAMEDIDALRDRTNLFDVKSTTSPVPTTVGGRTYTLIRTVSWTRSDGSATACGTGSGRLAYKAVSVTVRWQTSASSDGTQEVTTSSAVAPRSNLDSDTTGSILVGVTNAAGLGVAGIVPTVTGPSGVVLPTTDVEGCTYVSGVKPGVYTIRVARTGFVDDTMKTPSERSVTVVAGNSAAQAFTIDRARPYVLAYTNGAGLPATLATNMPVTLINPTSGTTRLDNAPTSASLFPFTSGYRFVAGAYATDASGTSTATCLSPEPGSWTTLNAAGNRGTATTPGDSPLTASMGAVTLTDLPANKYVTAVTTTPGAGDPGCLSGATLKFPRTSGTGATIALPWGTWRIAVGDTLGATTTPVALTDKNAVLVTSGAVANGVVTVDPRAK